MERISYVVDVNSAYALRNDGTTCTCEYVSGRRVLSTRNGENAEEVAN